MGIAELAARDRGAQLVALQRGRGHALASGDTRRQIESWNELGGAMLFGRTPVDEVLVFLDEELAWARERGLAAVEADALLGGPYLYSRLGRFDEARERLERSKAICRELGIAYGLAEAHMAGAEMEMLAGDAEAAERELRDAIRSRTEMGASYYVALYRTRIAHVLVALGRDEDALDELELARAVFEDAPKWKAARARVLAHRGETEEAVTLARDAVDTLAGTDDITVRAEILVDLAEVLRAHGDRSRRRRTALARGGRPSRGEGKRPPGRALPPASGGGRSRVGAHDTVSRRQPRGTSTTIVGSSRPAQRLPDETGVAACWIRSRRTSNPPRETDGEILQSIALGDGRVALQTTVAEQSGVPS